MTIGENIRKLREAKNFTQEALAEKVAVNRSYIAKIELDIQTPTLPMSKALAKALDCALTDLVSDGPETA